MRKRLIRIFGPQIIKEYAGLSGDVPLNVVLRNGNTVFGKPVSLEEGVIRLIDSRFHIHHIAVSDIDVIILDNPAPF